MTTIVISQPMYFPWIGLFEQIRLADVYVHYDDVKFSRGGFLNRVQIKTPDGFKWLTLPLKNPKHPQNINEIRLDDAVDWRRQHMDSLSQNYRGAAYKSEMLATVESVLAQPAETLADVAEASIAACRAYFDLAPRAQFVHSSALPVAGASSQRVFDVVRHFGGTIYVTGHGALNYLDHKLFADQGIEVEYLNYAKTPYPQLHGPFNPFVSILDLIANVGREGRRYVASGTTNWKQMVAA